MLSRAFRVGDADLLFKLRFFLQHLHRFIASSSADPSVKVLYRSQRLINEQREIVEQLANGGLIAFSPFFTASKDPSAPPFFPSANNEPAGEEITFVIDLANARRFVSIDEQILVTFGLVTRVERIDKDRDGRGLVHLKAISNDDEQLQRISAPMRRAIRAPYPALSLVKLFIELDQYTYAVHLGQSLVADVSSARKDAILALARLYHSLGTTLYEKEEFDQALDVIEKSRQLYLRFYPEDASVLSPTWNNIGSIYLRQGKTELALQYHEKALQIQLKSPSPDLASIVSYSNNIGGVYLKLERYDEALIHFQRALQIEEKAAPDNRQELAGSYHRIGGIYFRQNNFEKALEYYDKTLELELAALSDEHPTVAVTYHNRATALEGLGHLEEALASAELAVERLLKTMPSAHPQVRMNQAYVDKIKQKLWVKQLFST